MANIIELSHLTKRYFYKSTTRFILILCKLGSFSFTRIGVKGRVAQLVMCLATDACLTADPGVMSLIPTRSHTFVEIDHINNFYGHSPPFR